MGGRSKQMFLQRRHTDRQAAHENISIFLIIREIQIKTTMRYHLTPVRKAIIKKCTNNCPQITYSFPVVSGILFT